MCVAPSCKMIVLKKKPAVLRSDVNKRQQCRDFGLAFKKVSAASKEIISLGNETCELKEPQGMLLNVSQ